jgi:hypothetical protein
MQDKENIKKKKKENIHKCTGKHNFIAKLISK